MAVEKNNVVVVEHEFKAPVSAVWEALKAGRLFFNCGSWPDTLEFGPWGEDGKNSYLSLIHEGFTETEQAVDHHTDWNKVVREAWNRVCR